ncbi:MAG: DUF4845 domain-containing protein [Betaproteobacteria bacterium]|nr:DUF4845 domain-containing protein [Betaproteobacteria bacterium]
MHKQRGSMWVFISWLIIGLTLVWLGYQTVPAYLEYRAILKTARTITLDSQGNSGAPEFSDSSIRDRFRKQADTGYFTTPESLKISRGGGQVVITFDYEKRVHLFGFAYLVLDFKGDSSAK